MKRIFFFSLILILFNAFFAGAWTPVAVTNDLLVRMPGTQPGQVVDLDSDKNCLSCHAGGQYEMENWKGSLMAQASRDPVFWAGLTVAAQDAIWALGTPNAVDICVKCHFPEGWLDGRSDPVNASEMRGADYDGVSCKTCHYMYDPFYQQTYDGTREGNDWTNYWDETGDMQSLIDATRSADAEAAAQITHFNGTPFFSNNVPVNAGYTENGGGHIFLVTHTAGISDGKRAPFADANAKHDMLYSRYHKSKYMCGTCHDISNPALHNLGASGTDPLPSETDPAYSYAHVERTFSEFMLSGYSTNGGMAGTGPYSPDRFRTSHAGNKIATCQDCHFRDIDGVAAAKNGVIRPEESAAHPMSGVPEHRMIGGNLWVPYLLASIVPTSPNYDPTNETLLKQGPATLTLDFSQGEALDPFILLETISQSAQMLQDAISMTNASYALSSNVFTLRLQNHTGHKVISGYPEGRRMFLNIKAYVGDDLIYEINPYDYTIGTLKGLDAGYSQSSPALSNGEEYNDELVYELHQSSSLLGVNETFHMALATERYKDNRILPRGFRVADAKVRLCQPVWHGHSDTNVHSSSNFYTQAEYAGGYDEVAVELPAGTERVEAGLYYQTTSREFIEFLRDEINGTNGTLTGLGPGSGEAAYIAQTDDFFSGMAAWGDTIWQLWDHNKNIPGAAPVLMTNTLVQLDVSDADGDGIPAYWETQYFGGPTNANPTGHGDGDGVDNYSEYVGLTDPTDAESVFGIDMDSFGSGFGISFPSHYARSYQLTFTTNLVSGVWSNVPPEQAGADDFMTLYHTNDAPQGFYRVNVELP